MLTPARALALNAEAGRELPRVAALEALYQRGVKPRQGEVIMVAGRPGAQKSGFALFLAAEMRLPTLYLSADMSAFQASSRIASMYTGLSTEAVERLWLDGGAGRERIDKAIQHAAHITFSFGSITWPGVDAELESWIELHNSYPEVIVIDNLMDIEGTSSDYTAQMDAMQTISDLSRATGATIIVLHHASDKAPRTKGQPWLPPARDEVKGGLAEKPELSLTVALDPRDCKFNIACVKQRMGPCDASAETYTTVQAIPDLTRFVPLGAELPRL
jgi:AAA domain